MVSGAAPLPRGNHPGAGYLIVKPDYFQAMKIPVLTRTRLQPRGHKGLTLGRDDQ